MENYIMICPKCKSTDVMPDRSNPVQPALGLPEMYECNKCGHTGYTFPEVLSTEIDKLDVSDTSPDKTPKVDVSYGNFVVRVLWKVGGPIAILAGVFLIIKGQLTGIILLILGMIASYITYFKKREK
jgi:predicted nucleic-acid-binding Zn-ribbon protein